MLRDDRILFQQWVHCVVELHRVIRADADAKSSVVEAPDRRVVQLDKEPECCAPII